MSNNILQITMETGTKQTTRARLLEYSLFSLLIFMVPALLGGPQLLVGSAVNAILVLTAFRVRGTVKNITVIILPGISALLHGVFLGSLTPYLLYLLPAVWTGNFCLLFGIKFLYLSKQKKYAVALIAAAGMKVLVIFIPALILYSFNKVPAALLPIMSVIQAVTALTGGVTGFLVHKAIRYLENKNR